MTNGKKKKKMTNDKIYMEFPQVAKVLHRKINTFAIMIWRVAIFIKSCKFHVSRYIIHNTG